MCASVTYPTDGEMDSATIQRIFSEIGSLRLVRISGGEPFLRPDLAEVVRHIQLVCRPDVVHISTNGLLREQILDLVRDRRGTGLSLSVSLDGIGEAHERLRGAGTFARTYATIVELARLRTSHGFRLEVNCTLEADTLDEVERVDAEMTALGVSVSWLLAREFHPSAPPPTRPGHPPSTIYPPLLGAFDRDHLARTLDDILEHRIRGNGLPDRLARRYYLEGVRNRVVRGVRSPDPPCVSLTDHLRLMPNGDVTICRSDLTVAGNAAQEGFLSVWRGPRAARLRETVRRCRRCWYTCEAIPNGIFSGDLLRWVATQSWRRR